MREKTEGAKIEDIAMWETICTAGSGAWFESTERLKVSGGWLYRTQVGKKSQGLGAVVSTSLCFVPLRARR